MLLCLSVVYFILLHSQVFSSTDDHNWCIHSPADGHLACFQFLVIPDKLVMNICTDTLSFLLGRSPGVGLCRVYGECMLSF